MSPRDVLAALRRSFGGSALREPSTQGGSLLDRPLGVVKGRLLPASLRDDLRAVPAGMVAGAWVPWCELCRLEPVEAYTLGGAEYLARQHDIVDHGGAWTAQARPAVEVARLVAGGAR